MDTKLIQDTIRNGIVKWKTISGYISPVLDEAIAFKEHPGWVAGARSAMRLHSHVERIVGKPTAKENVFSGQEWTPICVGNEFDVFMHEQLQKQTECRETMIHPDEGKYRKLTCGEFTIGLNYESGKPALYMLQAEKEKTQEFLRELFWKHFNTAASFDYKNNSVEISEFSVRDSFETKLSQRYAEELKKYKDRGYCRSLMFYGPPGTGKSNICAQILKTCEYKVLVLPQIQNFLNVSWWQKNLALCKPDAVLIEDLDHVPTQYTAHILALIEHFYKQRIVILATCNKIADLDDALIRAERFDELVEIAELPYEVMLHLLNGDVDLTDRVRDFPIVAILELKRRIDVLGREEALARWDDLLIRVKRAGGKEKYKLTAKEEEKKK